MTTGDDYYLAWAIYLAAICLAHLVLWRMLRRLSSVNLRVVLHVCLFAILVTPAPFGSEGSYWVPAYMTAIMEGLNDGLDAMLNRMIPIFIVMLVLVTLSLLFNFIRQRAARR